MRRSSLTALLPIAGLAAVVAVVALASRGDGVGQSRYETGLCRTMRGVAIPLPTGMDQAFRAQYATAGDVLLVECAQRNPDTSLRSGGPWVVERQTAVQRLLNDNFKVEALDGMSLDRLMLASLAPDGTRVAGVRMRYDARLASQGAVPEPTCASDFSGAMRAARLARDIVIIDVNEDTEQTLVSLDALEAQIAADAPVQSVYVQGMCWLDDQRLLVPVSRELGADVPQVYPYESWECLYTIDVTSGATVCAYCADPGASLHVRHVVVPGRILVDIRDVAAMRAGWEFQDELVRAMQAKTDIPVERALYDDFGGRRLGVLDLSGAEPQLTMLDQIDVMELRINESLLSPDGRWLAFEPCERLTEAERRNAVPRLAIADVATGQVQYIEGERVMLQGWHPDGRLLLGILQAHAPADPPARLVEIPVGDVIDNLAANAHTPGF